MKKERAAFFCNIAAVVLVTAVLVSAAPRISAVGAVGQRVAAVFSRVWVLLLVSVVLALPAL